MEWQPIETAPKDECLLGFAETSEYGPVFGIINYVGRSDLNGIVTEDWEFDEGGYSWGECCVVREYNMGDIKITYWMPLPFPPALKGGE